MKTHLHICHWICDNSYKSNIKISFSLFSKMTWLWIKSSQSCRRFFLLFHLCLRTNKLAPLSIALLLHHCIIVCDQHVKLLQYWRKYRLLEPQKHVRLERTCEGHLEWKLKCHWKSSTTLFESKDFLLDIYLYRKFKTNLVLLPSRVRKVISTFVCHRKGCLNYNLERASYVKCFVEKPK